MLRSRATGKMLTTLLSLALLALPTVIAHGGVLWIQIDGTWYDGWQPYDTPVGQSSIIRPWSTYNPITDATDPTLSCNDDGTSSALQLTAPINAGEKITAYWNAPWPHPYGPMLVYMAACPGTTCTGVNSDTLEWFKIDESGLINGTVYDGFWGDGLMIADNSSWTTTIPATIPSGPYLIRFETIALHSLPAQMYPECAQLMVSGGGSQAPASYELVTFPGAYSNTDPGLTIDIYSNEAQTETTYPIPGPPLYGSPPPSGTSGSTGPTTSPGGGGGGGSPTTPTPTPSPSPTGPTVPEYGQCGGIGWTGGTACASPYTCQVINTYYSQCL
ncbi:carbohydrate-binding module family 1 protein [Collybiopsis luxurians FD-317 M1]|uniref:AA9 family lytic polysaccharide monooxygenase n=1 Tax=Collybiopsis luxurians FD-317 M1 TaxID=944289 RepID=A0A0D0CTG7_9AGAR|nr:carbohydrate-binding module family 1 protein [Collybiopsis luxurians FD-317 M1]